MDTMRFNVEQRSDTGNGPARRLRAQGKIPGVIYGRGLESTSVSVDIEELKQVAAHHNVVLELVFGGEAAPKKGRNRSRYAVVKEIQFHPTRRAVLHVDLHEVDLSEEIEASVAVELVGTPAGLADGGIIDWEHREVSVRALPGDVPESIPLDISALMIGQHLSVEALDAPQGVVILDDPSSMVVALLPPKVEAPGAGVEAGAEPELIGEEKGEE